MTLQNSFANPTVPQFPQMMPPFPPQADAEKAVKMWTWFSNSGLTVEELDALASLKKSGKDVGKLLGIKSKSDDINALRDEVKSLREVVSQLVSASKNPPTK